jgi:hypothetical protein
MGMVWPEYGRSTARADGAEARRGEPTAYEVEGNGKIGERAGKRVAMGITVGHIFMELWGFILTIVSTLLAIASIGLAVFAIRDNRLLRRERERAVIAAHATIERAYGTFIGVKAAIESEIVKKAVDDALSAINQQRCSLKNL